MAKKTKVLIILLQYNNSQDTIRCLDFVKKLDYPNFSVIIVDNGSEIKHTNEIGNWLKKKNIEPGIYVNFLLVTSDHNLGYSGGNNIGIRYALEQNADYVFILNPDTTIEKNTLTKLVEAAELDPGIGIYGPVIDEGDRTVCGGKIEWLKPELLHIKTANSKPETDFYIPGAAILIRRGVIEKIGLLDERYFLYFEDADYCERAKQAGYKLAVVSEALIYHKPSSSTSSLGAQLLLRYHYRNAHLFNWKNGPFWIKLILPFWSIFITIKQLAKIVLLPQKRQISRAILAGVEDFYRNHFGKINA